VRHYLSSCTSAAGARVLFLEAYGSTESGNLATNRRILPHVQWRIGSVEGTPPPPQPSTDEAPHLQVQVGEFLVKTGNMMFSGYYGDAEKTREAFTDDGFYRTGDLVRVSRDMSSSSSSPSSSSSDVADSSWTVDVIGRVKSAIKLGNGKVCCDTCVMCC
jgi:acyl-CoA synthetase (AMP-forming)/AMP-acid ligase II